MLSTDPAPARKSCVNAGVNEYLVKSSGALPALEEILTRLFSVENPADIQNKVEEPKVDEPKEDGKKGWLIVFLSAKGGTGTSSLCANLAMNIQQGQPEARVVVADLVLPIGSIGQIVGEQGKLNLVTISDLSLDKTKVDYFRRPQPVWQFQSGRFP
jgi:Mrp family chromosome partitioning ATPase